MRRGGVILPPGGGAFVEGQTFTLTGSGFGTRPDLGGSGSPFLAMGVNGFDGGVRDQNNLVLRANQLPAQWSLIQDGRYPGSWHARKTRIATAEGGGDYGEIGITQTDTPRRRMFTFWTRFNLVGSFKIARLYGTGPKPYIETDPQKTQTTNGSLYLSARMAYSMGGTPEWSTIDPATNNGNPIPSAVSPSNTVNAQVPQRVYFSDTVWNRVTIRIFDDPSYIDCYVNGSRFQWKRDKAAGDRQWFPEPTTYAGHSFGFGTDVGEVGKWVDIDDCVYDQSWASVELGNAPLWADVTHAEYQPAYTWQDNAIQIQAHPGAIGTGTRYLYVFRDDGTLVDPAGTPVPIG